MIPSQFQQAIFDFISNGSGNGVVNAVAGSGKTTTIVEAVKLCSGAVLFCAFNKHIETELSRRLAKFRTTVKTIHSIGYATLAARIGRMRVDGDKLRHLTHMEGEQLWSTLKTADREGYESSDMTDALRQAIHFVRATLCPRDEDRLASLVAFHGIDIPGGCSTNFAETVWSCVRASLDMVWDGIVDFDDMVFAPFALGFEPAKFDFVFVDEAQDLSAAQRWLVVNSVNDTGRIVAVGDPKQAIQGFAGADPESFDRLKAELSAVELPLSICYRCPPNHLKLAQQYVEQIQPVEGRENGIVDSVKHDVMVSMIGAQDLIISRKTAPLVRLCLQLIARKRPAKIRGRDIGAGLARDVKSISEMRGFAYRDFEKSCREWFDRKIKVLAKKGKATDELVDAIKDRCEAVLACHSGSECSTATELAQHILGMFSDSDALITLSTIHRSKGLEADRVFIIAAERLPFFRKGMLDWQVEQEECIHYVALTRAKQEMYFVEEDE